MRFHPQYDISFQGHAIRYFYRMLLMPTFISIAYYYGHIKKMARQMLPGHDAIFTTPYFGVILPAIYDALLRRRFSIPAFRRRH